MTREELHNLLDAVLDANESQDRYDFDCHFQNNYDGTNMAVLYIHDNSLDSEILKAQKRTGIVESHFISEISLSVPDAIAIIKRYQEGAKNDTV